MKKPILIILLALTILLAACVNQAPQESSTPSQTIQPTASPSPTAQPTVSPTEAPPSVFDYFPFAENVHMSYRGEGNEFAEFETYVDYLNSDAIQIRTLNPGTESVSVYVIEDGALKRVYREGETYYRQDDTGLRETEEIMIQEPIEVGTAWTLDNGDQRSITAVDAAVEVPFGSFEALEITTSAEDSVTKDYYVPGIGLIKRDFFIEEDISSTISSELETVEEGDPLALNLRFYYPDFDNDRLVYVERAIELYTGDSIPEMFEAQMKQVPSGSGLQPLMSAATVLSGLTYDKESGIVTADFSAEFIADMNAGAALEGMILSCVADTLGSYFQTDKVAVTVAGNSYESGHFSYEAGEYLTADPEGIEKYE